MKVQIPLKSRRRPARLVLAQLSNQLRPPEKLVGLPLRRIVDRYLRALLAETVRGVLECRTELHVRRHDADAVVAVDVVLVLEFALAKGPGVYVFGGLVGVEAAVKENVWAACGT
jgi:hypothetical protein